MAKNVKQGWQCPVCQTVYAPTVEKCECVKVPVQKWVYPYYPYYPYYPTPYGTWTWPTWVASTGEWKVSNHTDNGLTLSLSAPEEA